MSDTTLEVFDRKENNDNNVVIDFDSSKIKSDDVEFLNIVSDTDVSGVPWAWYEVREKLCEKGIGALQDVFEYYQEYNHFFDPWTNYLLACSHFDKEELNGKNNRQYRKQLEFKVKKLIKQQAKEPNKHMYQIMRENV